MVATAEQKALSAASFLVAVDTLRHSPVVGDQKFREGYDVARSEVEQRVAGIGALSLDDAAGLAARHDEMLAIIRAIAARRAELTMAGGDESYTRGYGLYLEDLTSGIVDHATPRRTSSHADAHRSWFSTADGSSGARALGLGIIAVIVVVFLVLNAQFFVPSRTRPATGTAVPALVPNAPVRCDASYPDACIAPYPPDLDCAQVSYRRFGVRGSDPHGFDADGDGIGCE